MWHHHNARELVDNPLKRVYQNVGLRYQYGVIGKNAYIVILREGSQQEIERFGYRRKGFLLPNGIQEERISFAEKSLGEIITFLNFGGRAHPKGLDILLQAVKILLERELNFIIQITDGVDTKETLKYYFGDSVPKQIVVVPQIENIQERFHGCDWFISASRHEMFSYAMAEAMLSGTPVLSSRIEGVSWALNQSSVVCFESESCVDLADKMAKIIRGKIKISENDLMKAREFILQNYTVNIWADKLMNFYDLITNE